MPSNLHLYLLHIDTEKMVADGGKVAKQVTSHPHKSQRDAVSLNVLK